MRLCVITRSNGVTHRALAHVRPIPAGRAAGRCRTRGGRKSLGLGLGALILLWPFTAAHAETRQIDPRNPPHGRFSDEWAEIYLAGGKVGYTHSTMTRAGNEIHSATTMKMRMGRLDSPVEIVISERAAETVDGRPVRFETAQELGAMKTSMKGTFQDGRMTVVSSQFGMEQKRSFDFPEAAHLKSWGMFRESLVRGFSPGTQYTLKVYEPAFGIESAVETQTTVADWEDFELRGSTGRGIRTTVVMESPIGSLTTTAWVNEHGIPLKAKVPVPGFGDLVIVAADQESALSDFVPPEIFMSTVVPANRPIDAASARRITYKITPKSPDIQIGDLPATGMQSVRPGKNGAVEVVVARQRRSAAKPAGAKSSASEHREYLDGNLMINVADPALIELAQKAAGGEKEPVALADRLRRFVTDYVETKSLNVGFATASEVCRTKEGDCSEHSVLLAALGRINGLPSRVVVGLVYLPSLGGRSDVFGYHMWTEFLIDGRWLDYDAALRESDCSPTRIAFATSSLKDDGLADLSLPLMKTIGAIDIEVLEIEDGPAGSGP